jgi:hypothetical protein
VRAGALFAPLEGRARVAAGLAAALALLVYGLVLGARRQRASPLPWGADATAYCRIAQSVVERGTFTLPPPDALGRDPQRHLETSWGTPYALTTGGRVLPKHSLLYALLLVPGFALGGAFGAFVDALVLSSILAGLVAARVSARFGAVPALAAALVLFRFTPIARAVALGINVDVALALAMVGAFAAAADGRTALAGAISGLALFLRPTAPLLFVPIALVLGGDGRAWRRFLLGATGPIVLFLGMNAWLWGAPWRTAYERALVLTPSGWALASHSALFGGGLGEGLRVLFLQPGSGVFVAAPALTIALLGYLLPEARLMEFLGAMLGGALALLSVATFEYVRLVPEFNYRFAFPLLVSCAPPLGALLARPFKSPGP